MPVVNTTNEHMSNFTSKVGAVGGYIGGFNPNIQRGGGYGFNGKGMPGFGPIPINSYSNCGTLKTPNLGVGKQYAGSPPPQRGGSSSVGCAGVPYASFVKPVAGLNNYAPVTQKCHSQCGGKKRRRRRRTKHRRRKRRQKNRRGQRGGYYQYGSGIPNTPGYATPAGGNWQTANPPTYTRINVNGTGSCVDNFNGFTGKGGTITITDGDVKQSGGGGCRRRGGRRRTKHRRRRTKHRRRRTKHRRRRTKHRRRRTKHRRRGGHHHQ